jgi:hypothetical protein
MLLRRILAAYATVIAFNTALVFLIAWLFRTPLVLLVLDKAFGPENCLGQFVQEFVFLGHLSLLLAVLFLCGAAMVRQEEVSPPRPSHRHDRYQPDFAEGNPDRVSYQRTHAHQP